MNFQQHGRLVCLLFICLVAVGRWDLGAASKILLMPFMFRSHVSQLAAIGNGLIDKGHDVYMLMSPSFPHHDAMTGSRIKLIDYQIKERDLFGLSTVEREKAFGDLVNMTLIESFRLNVDGMIQFCTNPFSDVAMFRTLEALELDLAVIDIFPLNRCLLILLYRLGIPYVSFYTAYEPWLLRAPALPSFVPFPLAGHLSEKMGFADRVKNTIILLDWTISPRVAALDDGLVAKYAPEKPAVSLNYLAGRSLLWLFNTDVVIDYPRPLMPNEINIGGILTKPAEPLSKDLEEFLESATHGAIVVSFGSLGIIPKNLFDNLLGAFTQLKQHVIFGYQFNFPAEVPDNTKILKWIPQNDILGHPKCKLFITHGGSNSQFEALYHSVPVINIPIFAEQPYNAKRAEYHGFGITMDVHTFTSDELVRNINEILSNTSYLENIKKRSEIFHSRPMKPRERAVYWIEQVLMYGGDHLRSHALDLAWYEYFMLDILALVLCLCLLGCCFCYKLLNFCCRIRRSFGKRKLE